jgi:arsenate reductase
MIVKGCHSACVMHHALWLRYRALVPPVRLIHHPQCSKSREALERLTAGGLIEGADLTIVHYLETPLAVDELLELMSTSDEPVAAFIRPDADPAFDSIDRHDARGVAALLAEHPASLQRPIVTDGSRTIIARPPERVEEFLGE